MEVYKGFLYCLHMTTMKGGKCENSSLPDREEDDDSEASVQKSLSHYFLINAKYPSFLLPLLPLAYFKR